MQRCQIYLSEQHLGRLAAYAHERSTTQSALIAATALATGRVLLTLNGKHFPRLGKGQLVVPYLKP